VSSRSKRTIFLGVERRRCVGLTIFPPSVTIWQCGILNISQTYRPPRPVTGIDLLFFYASQAVLRIVSVPQGVRQCALSWFFSSIIPSIFWNTPFNSETLYVYVFSPNGISKFYTSLSDPFLFLKLFNKRVFPTSPPVSSYGDEEASIVIECRSTSQ
jgi:hypothetical protein